MPKLDLAKLRQLSNAASSGPYTTHFSGSTHTIEGVVRGEAELTERLVQCAREQVQLGEKSSVLLARIRRVAIVPEEGPYENLVAHAIQVRCEATLCAEYEMVRAAVADNSLRMAQLVRDLDASEAEGGEVMDWRDWKLARKLAWEKIDGCDCVPEQGYGQRCSKRWIRCNGRLARFQADAAKLGPEPAKRGATKEAK